jgi:DNA repair protein RadA/Sms
VLWAHTDVGQILIQLAKLKPKVVVIDSIQTLSVTALSASPGSVSQVRACTQALVEHAKTHDTIILLVGHVTKDGHLAGPRVLEHMVDTVLSFTGEGQDRVRLLRATKNRFGPVNELGVFAMMDGGLKDVSNPSALFLSRPIENVSGSGVMVSWEGSRPLLLEMQALLDDSPGGPPRRLVLGVDPSRVGMLLAILHRHGQLATHGYDVFINVVGGMKVQETAGDLAVLATVVSSLKNQALPRDMVMFGELGLGGEVRPVPHGQERIKEAMKQGFKQVVLPKGNMPKSPYKDLKLHPVSTVQEALACLFT